MRLPTKKRVEKELKKKVKVAEDKKRKQEEVISILGNNYKDSTLLRVDSIDINLSKLRAGMIDSGELKRICIGDYTYELEYSWYELIAILVEYTIIRYGVEAKSILINRKIVGIKIDNKLCDRIGAEIKRFIIGEHIIEIDKTSSIVILENIARLMLINRIKQDSILMSISSIEKVDGKEFWAEKVENISEQVSDSMLFRMMLEKETQDNV